VRDAGAGRGSDRLLRSERWRRRIRLTPAAIGVGLAGASVAMELTDAEPRSEMWVSAASGAAFLIAVALTRGDEDRVLASRARLLIGAGGTAVLAVIGLWRATDRSEPAVLLLLVPALLLFVTALIAVREAGRSSHARRVSQLRSRFQGEESERRRWAQELHDQTLQDLAAVELRLAGLTGTLDPEALASGVEDTRVLVREQIRTLRHLITQMRPLALDTLGLAAALQDLARHAELSGDVLVRCDLAELPAGIDSDAQLPIYRIVQEALTNALHHSAAAEITIGARVRDDVLEITVRDDGIGMLAPGRDHPSFGRTGMHERAVAIQAELSWSTPPGGGTLVSLRQTRNWLRPTADVRGRTPDQDGEAGRGQSA
jgi:signal transduction histidine kinase